MLPPESALGHTQRAELESSDPRADSRAEGPGAAQMMTGKRTRTVSGAGALLKMLMEADSLKRRGVRSGRSRNSRSPRNTVRKRVSADA